MLLPTVKEVAGCCPGFVVGSLATICALVIYCCPGYAVPVAEGEALAVGDALALVAVGEAGAVAVATTWGVPVFAVFPELPPLSNAATPRNPRIKTLRAKQMIAILNAALGFFFSDGAGRLGVNGVCCMPDPIPS